MTWFLRVQAVAVLAIVVALAFATSPGRELVGQVEDAALGQGESAAAAASEALRSNADDAVAEETVVEPDPTPVAITTLSVYIGPNENYTIIGQIARNARVDVVGRDPTGAWLAINFTPGAKLNGWVPAKSVVGVMDITALPVAPVTLLPAR